MSEAIRAYLLHWTPDRALWIAGETLSWDARCAGIHIGCAIGLVVHLLVNPRANRLPPWPALVACAALFAPLFLDLLAVQYGLCGPSNDRRFLTGLLFGEAAAVFLYPAVIASRTSIGNGLPAIASPWAAGGLAILAGAVCLGKDLDSRFVYWALEGGGVLGNTALLLVVVAAAADIFAVPAWMRTARGHSK